MNKILSIIDRVKKHKAIGIIFNLPPDEEAKIEKILLDENHIIIKGTDAYRGEMLRYRLGKKFKVKYFRFCMLPGLLDNGIICIKEADKIKPSYSRVFYDFHQYKIPLLLLMNSDAQMKDLRMLNSYKYVLTIEQNFLTLK